MAACIDLLNRFGNVYRLVEVAGDGRKSPPHKRHYDPWQLEMPCTHGHIYPHGGSRLGAATNNRGPVAKRLAQLPGVNVVQDGDDGINVAFEVEAFDSVAVIVKPKRRRQLSAARRAEISERLRKHQFSAAAHNAGEDRRRVGKAQVESQQVRA